MAAPAPPGSTHGSPAGSTAGPPAGPLAGPPDSIGARIRAARLACGLTQAALAHAVGVSRSAVAQWETERSGQISGNLTRIAAALGVAAGDLLDGGTTPAAGPENATELALLRLYRACQEEDRAFLLRTATRLARAAERERGGG